MGNDQQNATAKVPGKRLPIVVVPGVMGSRLSEPGTNALVWNPTGTPLGGDPGSFAANSARLRNVAAPLAPDETNRYYLDSDHNRVSPIKHYYNVIAKFYGTLAESLHYQLRTKLASKRLVPAVYCCGYDWRQDNAASAARLATIVQEAQNDCEGEKVILVAHSMGGIVSRHLCKNLGGESKVRALILLGSPTLGAVKAYLNMRNGLPFFDTVRRVLHISDTESRDFMRAMQSAYQLLPTYVYCSKVRTGWATFDPKQTGYRDTHSPGEPMQIPGMGFKDNSNSVLFYNDLYTGLREYPTTRAAVLAQLTQAYLFHEALTVGGNAYMHPNTVAYYSTGKSTSGNVSANYQGVTIGASQNIEVSSTTTEGDTVPGDETVPADSAFPKPISAPFTDSHDFGGVDHVSLSSDSNVINAVMTKIAALV